MREPASLLVTFEYAWCATEDIGAPIQMSVKDAKMRCADLRGCEGFSEETLAGGAGHNAALIAAFEAASGVAAAVEKKPTFMHFKRNALQSGEGVVECQPYVSCFELYLSECRCAMAISYQRV